MGQSISDFESRNMKIELSLFIIWPWKWSE